MQDLVQNHVQTACSAVWANLTINSTNAHVRVVLSGYGHVRESKPYNMLLGKLLQLAADVRSLAAHFNMFLV